LTKQENQKLQEEIERLRIDVQRELDNSSVDIQEKPVDIQERPVDIQEKPVDKTKTCNHGPQIRELQGKVEELERDIFLKESEIEKLN